MKKMSILIGGDLLPMPENEIMFEKADTVGLLGEPLCRHLEKMDYRIFNLEGPLIKQESPIWKDGPILGAGVETINGIKAMQADLLSLANNHILDHGIEGLRSTLETLKKHGIAYVGAGLNEEEARKPYILQKNGVSVGIYSCAEHEFNIADKKTGGANPVCLDDIRIQMENMKKYCDYVIVIYHGMKEFFQYPSPKIQELFRKIADFGADIVLAQHSHCIGCTEKYHNKDLIYGQGNFLFAYGNHPLSQYGLLIELCIEDGIKVNYLPIKKSGSAVCCIKRNEEEKVMNLFYERSSKIKDSDFVQKNYQDFADSMLLDYLKTLNGNSFFFRLYHKMNKIRNRESYYDKEKLCKILNCFQCEAHRELIIEALKKAIS